MMPIEILMPALSPTMEEGTLATWSVKEGDVVSSGDVLAEIETDKATMEVEAVEEARAPALEVEPAGGGQRPAQGQAARTERRGAAPSLASSSLGGASGASAASRLPLGCLPAASRLPLPGPPAPRPLTAEMDELSPCTSREEPEVSPRLAEARRGEAEASRG